MSVETKPIVLTEQDFDAQVLQSDQPVLVDFWAPWCQPCLMLAPTIDSLAEAYGDQLKVAKVNVDDHPQLGATHQINSIPSVILFKDGQVMQKFIGMQPKAVYVEAIDKLVNGSGS